MLWFDGNGNGLPDSWEITYFGNLNQTATGDFDGDGVSNLQEFLDGTNPNNPASALYRLTVLTDGGSVSIVPNLPAYTNGQAVTLTATPANAFRAWTGGVFTRSNTVTLTMTTNLTLSAHFTTLGITWTNAAGGDWNNPTNWSPNLIPGSNDNVFITLSASINVSNATECGSLVLGGLSGSGTLTLHGSSVWNLGNMNGTGRIVIAPEGTLTIASLSSLALGSGTLENAGILTWSYLGGGGLTLYDGAVITNRPGAICEVQVPGTISYGSGTACRFDNAGTFLKTIDGGTAAFGSLVNFNNYGTVAIDSGTLQLSGAFTNTGTVNISSGALSCNSGDLFFTGPVNLSPGTTCLISGTGSGSNIFTTPATALVNFTGGTFTLNSGAQLNGDGLYEVTGSATLAVNAAVSIENLELSSILTGSGTLRVSSLLNWSGGAISGTGRTLVASGATLDITNTTVSLDSTLENAGATLVAGNGRIGGNGAVITNDPGAVFQVQNNASFIQSGSLCRFDNAGTYRKSVSAGTNSFAPAFAFNNYGEVDVQAGTLLFNGDLINNGILTLLAGATNRMTDGGSGSGTFTAPANSLMEWSSGPYTLNPGAQLNGVGLYQINGNASLIASTDVALQNLNLVASGARLDGNATVTVNNVLNWTDGTMTGNGTTIIGPNATLNLANTEAVSLFRALENAGTVLWTGTGDIDSLFGTVITNRSGALFDVRNNASFTYVGGTACRFDNAGTFRKEASTGTTTFTSLFSFNNYNTVDIRSGIVMANGGYTCTTNSTLACALGGTNAGTGYGQLQAAHSAWG